LSWTIANGIELDLLGTVGGPRRTTPNRPSERRRSCRRGRRRRDVLALEATRELVVQIGVVVVHLGVLVLRIELDDGGG